MIRSRLSFSLGAIGESQKLLLTSKDKAQRGDQAPKQHGSGWRDATISMARCGANLHSVDSVDLLFSCALWGDSASKTGCPKQWWRADLVMAASFVCKETQTTHPFSSIAMYQ